MEETKKKQIPKHLVDVGFPHSARVGDMKRRLSKFLDTPWIDMKIKEERAKNIHIYFLFFRNEIFRRMEWEPTSFAVIVFLFFECLDFPLVSRALSFQHSLPIWTEKW